MNDLSNTRLGQYQLFQIIGKGGMATVYRARQLSVGRDVAVKVLSTELVGNAEFIARFEREAHIIAGLQHPHILTVYDFGREGRLVYLVMRLMEGGSLAKELATTPRLSQQRVLTLVRQIASALDYAHTRGIVHRDLKPTNVLLDEDGNAYLTDFGIAKMIASTTVDGLTQPGSVMGTPSYMAPEQWRSEPVDARTDIYALGIMAYQMLAGQVPFNAETPHGLMYLHLDRDPIPPHTLNPALPAVVDQVIARVLAKAPSQRYNTAPAFVADLEQALLAPERFGLQPPLRPQADGYDQFAERDLMARSQDASQGPTVIPRRPAAESQAPARPVTPSQTIPSQAIPPQNIPAQSVPPNAGPPQAGPPQQSAPTANTIPQQGATPGGTGWTQPPTSLDQPAVRSSPQPRYTTPTSQPVTPGMQQGLPLSGAPAVGYTPAGQLTGPRRTGQTGPLRPEIVDPRLLQSAQDPTGLQISTQPVSDHPLMGCLRSVILVVMGLALFGGVLMLIVLALRIGGDDDSPQDNPTAGPQQTPVLDTTQPGIPPNMQILSPQGEVTMQLSQSLPVQFVAGSVSGVTRVEMRRFSQTLDTRTYNGEVEVQGTFTFVPDSAGLNFLEIVAWSGGTRGVPVQITVRVQ